MNKTAISLALAGMAALPAIGQAREINLSTTLKDYRGNEAYLAIYVTDAQGAYQRTLWVAGKKAKYYKHLRDWSRGSSADSASFDGITGASVGSGETLTVSVELADALLDAGYEIRVDSAVENKRDNRADIKVPLTTQGAGQASNGSGYIEFFTYDL